MAPYASTTIKSYMSMYMLVYIYIYIYIYIHIHIYMNSEFAASTKSVISYSGHAVSEMNETCGNSICAANKFDYVRAILLDSYISGIAVFTVLG
jgi:hypothetical protein